MLESSLHLPIMYPMSSNSTYPCVHFSFFHLHLTLGASSIHTKLSYISFHTSSTVHHSLPSLILTFTFPSSIHLHFPYPYALSIHFPTYIHNPSIHLILTCYPSPSPCHVHPFSIHTRMLPSFFHMSLILVIPSILSTSYPFHLGYPSISLPHLSYPPSHIPYSFHFHAHSRDPY